MTRRPNLLMIVLDQLRYDCLGLTSGNRVATPVLDELTASGTWFDHAYSHLPTCCPARQSLLTGQRPESFGAHWNYDNGLSVASLTPDAVTWPALLSDAGYRTAYLGKWHVSPDHDPTAFGYDRYVCDAHHHRAIGGRPDVTGGFFGGVSPLATEDAAPHWYARRAADEIRVAVGEGRPWHVRLDLVEPHLPCTPTEEFAALYPADKVEPWPSFAETFEGKPYIQHQQLRSWDIADWTWEEWAPVVARYLAVVTEVDNAIGTLLAALDATGQRDDTIIVVTTDHGDMGGAHRMMDKHYVLYDDVVRVPMIVSGPGIAAGQSRDEFVYNLLDFGPTITELLHLPDLPDTHGRSLVPLLRGDQAPDDWRDAVVCTYNGQQFGLYTQRALRTARWKYVWNATDVDELYDLTADPHELTNVAQDVRQADTLAELRRRLWEDLESWGDRQIINPWLRRQFLDGAKA